MRRFQMVIHVVCSYRLQYVINGAYLIYNGFDTMHIIRRDVQGGWSVPDCYWHVRFVKFVVPGEQFSPVAKGQLRLV